MQVQDHFRRIKLVGSWSECEMRKGWPVDWPVDWPVTVRVWSGEEHYFKSWTAFIGRITQSYEGIDWQIYWVEELDESAKEAYCQFCHDSGFAE